MGCIGKRGSTSGLIGLILLGVVSIPGRAEAKDSFKAFKLQSFEGVPKTLEDFLNKATLVTFFFPTCGSCNAEFPHLQTIAEKYKSQGLSTVAINVVVEQNSQVSEWRQTHGYTIPVLVTAEEDALMRDYDLKMTPTHFLLDSKGKVLFKQVGYVAGDETVLEERIRKALNPAP